MTDTKIGYERIREIEDPELISTVSFPRKWKLDLIESVNPEWEDLSKDWIPDQVGNDS